MFSFVNNIYNYFFGYQDTDASLMKDLSEALEILQQPDPDDQINNMSIVEPDSDLCLHRTGAVTVLNENFGMIDDRHYFNVNIIKIPGVLLNSKVSYVCYKMKETDQLNITKIYEVLDDTWDQENERTEFVSKTETKNKVIKRTVIGQVIGRKGREVILTPQNYTVNLDDVRSEFVPIQGDWIALDALTEYNEEEVKPIDEILSVINIYPLRSKQITGFVKKWNNSTSEGVINDDIYFTKDWCEPGYVANIDDKVVCEIIESAQSKYSWRALTVVPISINNSVNKSTIEIDNLTMNKNGIEITEDTSFKELKIGDIAYKEVTIKNTSLDFHRLYKCRFHSKRYASQLTLTSHDLDTEIFIRPKCSIVFKFKCNAKFLGTTKELFVFTFKGFKIGRWFVIDVANDEIRNIVHHKHPNFKSLNRVAHRNDSEILLGTKPIKTPAFVPIRIQHYNIPSNLWNVLVDPQSFNKSLEEVEISIESTLPCLRENLSIVNYKEWFHALLYLEEIQMILNMQMYNIEKGYFIENGEYLMLEVPNLHEKRPSLIIGDRILASDPYSSQDIRYEGYIHKIYEKHVLLKFHSSFHSTYTGQEYNIEFNFSRMPLRRCHQAIDLAVKNLKRDFLFPSNIKTKPPQIEFTVADDNEFKKVNISQKYISNLMKEKRKETPIRIKVLKLHWLNKKLNYYQKEAIKNILKGVARPLPYIIFGPPGTGKTVTIVETILQIFRMLPGSRIIATSPSNSSADLLATRLLDSGVLQPGDLVRLVAHRCVVEGMVPEHLIPYCVTGDLAREGTRQKQEGTLGGVQLNYSSTAIGRHRITVSTCVAAGQLYNMGLPKDHFTHVIVDEAGHAPEPEILVPLSLLNIDNAQVVLAGDPLQLGPIVMSRFAERYGLSESLLERLIRRSSYCRDIEGFRDTGGYDPRVITRLAINYRSVPEILELPNSLFYNSELIAAVSQTEGKEADMLQMLKEELPPRTEKGPPAVVFHGIRGDCVQDFDCPSWYNPCEVAQVYFYLNRFYDLGLSATDIGIITPYTKQVQQIRFMLSSRNFDLPKIGSIEEFQGQERNVILLTTVRSSSQFSSGETRNKLGFLSNPRRLNVALTRARALVIIIGNPHVLSEDPFWRSTLTYCIKNDAYIGCDLPLQYLDVCDN